MKELLKKIPVPFKGEIIDRKENCKICGEKKGMQIGRVDYWDITSSNLIKCTLCRLVQLDPMLTEEETAKGCLAYYIEESLRVTKESQGKDLVRNFRRGVLFASSLKRKDFHPKEILELGPGSGYFSEGIKFIYPDVNVTVMDVNNEVLAFNKQQHGFATVQSTPEKYISNLENKFDLIVARDILEHVTDVAEVIQHANKYLKANGLFHFITPNGHEDVWKHYLTFNHRNKNSELLINHVNYFDGKGLLDLLARNQFSPVEYYTYNFKTTRRGRGWKVSPKQMAPLSTKKSSDFYIKNEISKVREIHFDKKEVLNKWYIQNKIKFITRLMSWYHHSQFIRLSPELNVGHEIYGLFKKIK
ncbi:MAG TPA: class I SAM-dependent methyltransferase [Bacteroidia bacterium]